MAYEAPALGTAGQVYTAAAHNIIVNDVIALRSNPMVKAIRSSTFAISSGALTVGPVALEWNAVSAPGFDNDTMWTVGSPTRLTVVTAGVYLVTLFVQPGYSADPGRFRQTIAVKPSGTEKTIGSINTNMSTANGPDIRVSAIWDAAIGDYFLAYVGPTLAVTATVTTNSYFSAVMLGKTS